MLHGTSVIESIKDFERRKEQSASHLSKLKTELDKVKNAGILRFFKRSVAEIEKDINDSNLEKKHLKVSLEEAKQKMHDLAPQYKELQGLVERNMADGRLSTCPKGATQIAQCGVTAT